MIATNSAQNRIFKTYSLRSRGEIMRFGRHAGKSGQRGEVKKPRPAQPPVTHHDFTDEEWMYLGRS